jgi:hypothetical protein
MARQFSIALCQLDTCNKNAINVLKLLQKSLPSRAPSDCAIRLDTPVESLTLTGALFDLSVQNDGRTIRTLGATIPNRPIGRTNSDNTNRDSGPSSSGFEDLRVQ